MTLVAACIVILNLLLFCAIPQIGILYLPLFGFLAAAIAIIPYREYRQVQQVIERANIHPSPELVMINLRNLKPQLRVSALLLLGLALATGIGLFFLPGPLVDRIPSSILLIAVAVASGRFIKERRILARCSSVMAKIIRFERRRRQGRVAIYEYESSVGEHIAAEGGPLTGFSVGMTVPVLYDTLQPHESIPVTDFLFYTFQAQQ